MFNLSLIPIIGILFFLMGYLLSSIFSAPRKKFMRELETITENVPNIPIQGFDVKGKIFLWNRASEMTYGYKRTEAIGKNIAQLVLTKQEQEPFFEAVDQICKNRKAGLPRQWTVLTRSGQMLTMYSTMFPYMNRNECLGIFCFDIDISDIKRYEEELKFAKESYQAIFNSVNEAIIVISPDNAMILDINDMATGLFGYEREKLQRLYLHDLSYGNKDALKEEAKTLIAKAFYEGPQVFEWLCVNKSGEIFPAELNMKKASVRKRECLLVSVFDISEKRRAEEKLRESEMRYRMLFENANDLIFTLNKKGLFTNINEAAKRIAGYEKSEVLGKHFFEFLPEEEKQKATELFEKIINGAEENQQEIRCLTKSKGEVVFLFSFWPLKNKNSEIHGIHAIGKDITDRKLILDKMRDMVIRTVSMLSQTVSVADRYTEGHCERLSELSIKIGESLNLSAKQLDNLKYAALLHDVGKVGIPIHILLKKEKLTDEEWQRIKEHPKKGADIVRQISGFEEIATIIEQHQERVDGKGYPQGLKEGQIKREAAIISVIDAYDAMISNRPYRKALSKEEAIQELESNAGTQFDAAVVKAFVEILRAEVDT